MNMFKKNGGFTLVELIVVIAILAILAGVAIPAYSGYINKANDTAVMAELEAVETAAYAAAAMKGDVPVSITVSAEGKVAAYVADTNADNDTNPDALDITTFFAGDVNKTALGKHSTFKAGCSWTAEGGWVAAN